VGEVVRHPVIPAPGLGEIEALARERGCSPEVAALEIERRRRAAIRAEQEDPLRCGWEPLIWKVADALVDWPWCEAAFARRLAGLGTDWGAWKTDVRTALGLGQRVKMLLVQGGNRSGKSEWAAKRSVELAVRTARANVYACHMSNPRSIRDMQPLFWKYLPPEWRRQVKSELTYIAYKAKTGFSEGSFIAPNGSEVAFLNYMQDMRTALEGIEANWLWGDELMPPDWVETIPPRLSTRDGTLVVTFTPVNGFTPTVGIWLTGAKVARWETAWLLPKDKGEPDEAGALGLTGEEYAEVKQAAEARRPATAPLSRPTDDPLEWTRKQGETDGKYQRMPRVALSQDPRKAVVYFHGRDNPYGNPPELLGALRESGEGYVKERWYGWTARTVSAMFPRFSEDVHVLDDEAVPADGLNFCFCDPASDRNFFWTWIRLTREGAFVYREWPGGYVIPEVGVPGPWAIPSGRKEGLNDGARGEGQGPWGFGLARYKFEIARLERWAAWREWAERGGSEYPGEAVVSEWEESAEDGELIEERFVDSRAATTPRVEADRPRTLQADFAELALYMSLTPGKDITSGVERINTLLDYQAESKAGQRVLSYVGKPKLMVARSCRNTIYALANWMNVDGERGACKDPVDNLRYFATSDLEWHEAGRRSVVGGTSYGSVRRRRWVARERYFGK